MSGGSGGGKKKSGFQITSVTSEFNQTSSVPPALQSASLSCSPQGSSSQPTTPSSHRKYVSGDAAPHGTGPSSRFRVVRLVGGGAIGGGRGEPYRRGRWTCTDFGERQEGAGFRRVMDSMRHAHSLESLEMIGRERDGGGVRSQDTAHLLAQPMRSREGLGPRSGTPSPTRQATTIVRLRDDNKPTVSADSAPAPPSTRPGKPSPLRLDIGTAGQSVHRLSRSQPSSPPARSYHPCLTPIQTPAAFGLDQTIFSLPGDASSSNSLLGIDNKIEQVMDLVKSHLMLAVREEVELLREQIRELQEKNQQLQRENHILRALTHTPDHSLHT